ncbi:Polyketide synthase-nonribosomal peptide synthetase 3 [Colletotrichum chlorophyti]|uniref:Polyketide synthase-nonribosomal peptide synthetase 3 n=1 Tax=Colletotrichum chlorophyti TaxID=708187 RepID=A0A1Q8RZU3_9PEZI|nr:Polyketide synthase-nonribosomal peptide synthetase 3 [Colletotrichum chlorophyti]
MQALIRDDSLHLNGVKLGSIDSTVITIKELEVAESVSPATAQASPAPSIKGHLDSATDNRYPQPDFELEDDPACIVGIACRLPGGIRSPSDLWDLLKAKKTTQGRVPLMRFNMAGYYHPDGKRAGVMDADGGYFLDEDVRKFDNEVLGLNNLEATYMDPQQRKLLEVTYECLENAGLSMEAVAGSDTAVYVGNFTVDYQTMQTRDPDYLHRYSATGSGTAIMANRISHVFDLHGPSFTLDTACSSSIYALHNAVRALRNGDCEAAIVAGANLITSVEQHLGTMKGGVLSPTSTCHTFDASADGYGRAEAVNAIYIKPLSRALQNGDHIRAVIRGTAINSNGRTNGITQPSAVMQAAVIRKAYANAGLRMADTDYVECHGTGTAVGDPIEVEGIGKCFARDADSPLMIGAIKTNIGHSEAASGLSAVIKAVLSFEKERIPPTYGVTKLNPKQALNLQVVNELATWPRSLRRASINSFGYGGANAHVILEAPESYMPGLGDNMPAPGTPSSASDTESDVSLNWASPFVLPVSANSHWSLEKRIEQITQYVKDHSIDTLPALAKTLAKHRSHQKHRACVVVSKPRDPNEQLITDVFSSDERPETSPPPFAFVFTGQGAQYAGMGRELLLNNASFRASIQRLDHILQALPEQDKDGRGSRPAWTLEQTLLDPPETSMINDVTRSQPICTAVQVALVDLLADWNVFPQAVVGHSSGEIAAAYAAGRLSAAQAIKVAYFRGAAVGRLQGQGGMLAAGLKAEEAAELISQTEGLAGRVCVACINAPESVTLSGELDAINSLTKILEERGKFVRALKTGGRAYHSHMMKEVGALYEDMLTPVFSDQSSDTEPAWPSRQATMYSSVGSSAVDLAVLDQSGQRGSAKYWRENLETAVQFCAALTNLTASAKKLHLIEIGPHAALKGPIEQTRKKTGHNFRLSATLVRGEDAEVCIKKLAGELFVRGNPLEWSAVNDYREKGTMTPLHDLPPYPWDYTGTILWSEPRPSVEQRNRQHIRHELLGTSQLAGNGIDYAWRNVLRLSEVPWVRDHKLESQIVFPATGYLGIIMEALCQVRDVPVAGLRSGFEFRNVNIGAAMVVPEQESEAEIHTTLSARKISTAAASSKWFEFSISSWDSSASVLHCSGSVRMLDDEVETSSHRGLVSVQDIDGYETWGTMNRWYSRLSEAGLRFGPDFQSITAMSTDGSRVRPDAISTTKLFQQTGQHYATKYAMHPLVLDACLQAGIFGGTAGDLNSLRAYLPVFIKSCRIRVPKAIPSHDTDAAIHTRTRTTGFGTKQIDCTLFQSSSGAALVDMEGVKLSLYSNGPVASVPDHDGTALSNEPVETSSMKREPCLSVRWKPDIVRLQPENTAEIQRYLDMAIEGFPADLTDHASMAYIVALIDLVSFKNPKMSVLELGGIDGTCQVKRWLKALEADTTFPRCSSWIGGVLDSDGKLQAAATDSSYFDTLVIPGFQASSDYTKDSTSLIDLINPESGVIIVREVPGALEALRNAGLSVIDVGRGVLVGRRPLSLASLAKRNAIILVPSKLGDDPQICSSSESTIHFGHALAKHLKSEYPVFSDVQITTLDSIAESGVVPSSSAIYISLLELHKEFLATMSPTEMDQLRHVTDVATDLIWLTGADMLGASPDPNLTLSSGLSRALMLEQPSLRYTVLDIGSYTSTNTEQASLSALCANLAAALVPAHDMDDKEFSQSNGILHISRFVADKFNNSLFRRRTDPSEPLECVALSEVGLARLAIGSVGQMDTLHFAQEIMLPAGVSTPAGFVDIQTKAVSLNAKDIYTVSGRVETRTGTAAIEFSGVVVSVGEGVTHLAPGDHVVVLAPNRFATVERVPAWAAHKMLPSEDFRVMPTLPVAFGTALYALHDRAHIRAGESILVHSGAGAFGMATIMLAQRLGAVVYATVGSPAKKEHLVRELRLPAENIFSSRDASFVHGIRAATEGRGVDVVINSLVGDLMHDSWDCIAEFGRFVEVGKRELVDAGKLDMHVFTRNCSFTAFDLTELFYHKDQFYRDIWINKTREALELYRTGAIKPVPIATFDVSKLSQAYRFFSAKDRIGKVVVSMQDARSLVPTMPTLYKTMLSSEKVYLLVGCLGGLGRSLSRWMMARGARHFVFLGRSGSDKPEARSLVSRLRGAGASVVVVRGDVSNQKDVDAAVDACSGRPIGGVVQAAMGLSEALFSRMTHKAWHTGIKPKWAGSWNLDRSLARDGRDANLDFFLLTSSVSGSVGTATESNYCSANGFLDAFARYRRSCNKPAVSVGLGMISEVGYLHENPEIEALLLRKGIQPLNENEFLQVIDFALAPGAATPHILTGLEPFGLRELIRKGFDVENGTTQDPRCGFLAAALFADQEASKDASSSGAVNFTAAPAWLRALPTSTAAKALAAEADAATLCDAVLRLARKRFSNLILLPLDKIDDNKALPQFGLDSMIAAEYRTWFWTTFKVDVPFLDIMSPKKSLLALANFVEDNITATTASSDL